MCYKPQKRHIAWFCESKSYNRCISRRSAISLRYTTPKACSTSICIDVSLFLKAEDHKHRLLFVYSSFCLTHCFSLSTTKIDMYTLTKLQCSGIIAITDDSAESHLPQAMLPAASHLGHAILPTSDLADHQGRVCQPIRLMVAFSPGRRCQSQGA